MRKYTRQQPCTNWIRALSLCVSLALAGCGPPVDQIGSEASPSNASVSQTTTTVPPPTNDEPGQASNTPNQPTTTATSSVTDSWPTYYNQQAHYSVDYPANWIVDERVAQDDTLVATFIPPDGGASINVIVRPGGSDITLVDPLPNTRCQQVEIGGLQGTRCLDTISLSISTTLVEQGRTYVITTAGKPAVQTVYRRMTESFQIAG